LNSFLTANCTAVLRGLCLWQAGVLDLDFLALLLKKAVQFWQLDVSNGACASEC